MILLSLSLVIYLHLKSTLSSINVTTSALWLIFAWHIFFHKLTFNMSVYFLICLYICSLPAFFPSFSPPLPSPPLPPCLPQFCFWAIPQDHEQDLGSASCPSCCSFPVNQDAHMWIWVKLHMPNNGIFLSVQWLYLHPQGGNSIIPFYRISADLISGSAACWDVVTLGGFLNPDSCITLGLSDLSSEVPSWIPETYILCFDL